jgi:hypothetical protein
MAAKVSFSIAEPALLEWAKQRADRQGVSLSSVITDAIRRARQHEARERVLAWLGPAATLTLEREAEILAEWGEPAEPPSKPWRQQAMTSAPGLTFDTGALMALERRHAAMAAVLALATKRGRSITVPAAVVAEWWRGRSDRREDLLERRSVRFPRSCRALA